jgi:hypothetical protein
MPISYRIDKDLGLLTVVGSGTVTDEDISACKDSLKSEPELRHVTRDLTDFRGTSFTISPKGLPSLAKLHESALADAAETRCAVVVSNDLQYGLVRVYAQCVARLGHEVAPFRTMAEAREWLGLPAESEDA